MIHEHKNNVISSSILYSIVGFTVMESSVHTYTQNMWGFSMYPYDLNISIYTVFLV